MIKQVHPNSLAECLGLDKSENKVTPKRVISPEVLSLISKIPNRVGVVVFERKTVVKKKILKVQSL